MRERAAHIPLLGESAPPVQVSRCKTGRERERFLEERERLGNPALARERDPSAVIGVGEVRL